MEARVCEYDRQRRGPHRGFVSSDLTTVYSALQTVVNECLAPGPVFCDWGSGYGAVTALASLLGFEAYGIEIQADLVSAAEELAEDFGLDVRYAHGTFVPPGNELLTAGAEFSWWDTDEPSGYEVLDLDPEHFDVFYAYPWPGEESLIDALFAQCASVGALLITYHGVAGMRLQRKIGASSSVEGLTDC